MLINNNMWNRQIKTCELNDPISIIIGEILGIGFILIMLLICIIIKFSMKCTCSKDIQKLITKNNDLICSLETENLMITQNNKNDQDRLLHVLESIADNIIVRPKFFDF